MQLFFLVCGSILRPCMHSYYISACRIAPLLPTLMIILDLQCAFSTFTIHYSPISIVCYFVLFPKPWIQVLIRHLPPHCLIAILEDQSGKGNYATETPFSGDSRLCQVDPQCWWRHLGKNASGKENGSGKRVNDHKRSWKTVSWLGGVEEHNESSRPRTPACLISLVQGFRLCIEDPVKTQSSKLT